VNLVGIIAEKVGIIPSLVGKNPNYLFWGNIGIMKDSFTAFYMRFVLHQHYEGQFHCFLHEVCPSFA
jgi:hypothetical protein